MSEPKKPFNNPFAALGGLREGLPEGQPERVTVKAEPKPPAKAVVRLERAGRRGKEVTVIEHLGLAAEAREVWLKALKSSLGCGGVVEEEALVLQGDHRERAAKWLTARGVKKVSVGN
jgi:translation initiation factor 1